jgi:4-hydroxybenzoate polyprenyltransferase
MLRATTSGRAGLKRTIARERPIDPALLPYDRAVLAGLRRLEADGAELILVSSADQTAARAVADHLGIFADVLASDGTLDLGRRAKLAAVRRRAGNAAFSYLSSAAGPGLLRPLIRALRPHQWAKNLLVLLGPLIGLGLYDPAALQSVGLLFVTFCLMASLAYLLNDILDLPADRAHDLKRARPLARGDLPVQTAHGAGAILALVVGVAALWLPAEVGLLLLAYLILTALYSVRLKEVAIVDLFLLASFYLARVIAGLIVVDQPLTIWLGGLLFFLFLNLALLKRFTELTKLRRRSGTDLIRRGYNLDDLGWILAAGVGSAFAAVVMILLYAAFEPIADVYARPAALALLAPLFLGFVLWLWRLGAQGTMDEDPVLFVLRSRVAYLVLAAAAAVLCVARLGTGEDLLAIADALL